MEYISLGKTNMLVSRTAFGAMSLGKVGSPEIAISMVKSAYDEGVNFFDVSKDSPESEILIGKALSSVRKNVFFATKSSAHTSEELTDDIDQSLRNLNTDYIDLYQLEKPNFIPTIGGEDGLVEKLMNLKSSRVIRHFGITTESIDVALSLMTSDVPWETIQFPFNMLCGSEVERLVEEFAKADIGFIAMRPLCGGILSNIPLALGYLRQFENVVPVWGARTLEELQQILYFTKNPPVIDDQFIKEAEITRERFN